MANQSEQSKCQSAEIFSSTGVALHTTRTTLHRLGRFNYEGAFKGFIMDDTALSAYHASAERLAFYALVFSLR